MAQKTSVNIKPCNIGSSEAQYKDEAENALVFGGYEVRFALLDGAKKLADAIRGIG